jgi:hypothetical protein
MRENRPYGSEGGEGQTLPDPYPGIHIHGPWLWIPALAATRLGRNDGPVN